MEYTVNKLLFGANVVLILALLIFDIDQETSAIILMIAIGATPFLAAFGKGYENE